jgi:tetratricopeptide (TPR) repeat protein
MKFKLMSKLTAMIFLLGFAVHVKGQTAAEAVDALKDGVAKSQAKEYVAAIESFKECVEIYEQIGESENENAITAASQITSTQYKYAISLYKEKKYDESIAAFKKLAEYSETYNDPQNLKKAKSTIPKLYYAQGASLLQSEDYEGALTALDKSLELDPKYAMTYIRKAQVYKEQNDDSNFKTAIDGAISASVAKKDSKTESVAKELAYKYYLSAGVDAIKGEKYDDAEKYLNNYMEYQDPDSDIYYQLAVIYNKQSKWDEAVEASNKALELFTDQGTTKDAKIYYELGNAYYGKGDNAAACDAYSKANKGDYAQAAEYQIKHVVKCQ